MTTTINFIGFTSDNGKLIYLCCDNIITEYSIDGFIITIDGENTNILTLDLVTGTDQSCLIFRIAERICKTNNEIKLAYNSDIGNLSCGSLVISSFSLLTSNNSLFNCNKDFNNALFLEARLPLINKRDIYDCIITSDIPNKFSILQLNNNTIDDNIYNNKINTIVNINNINLICPEVTEV